MSAHQPSAPAFQPVGGGGTRLSRWQPALSLAIMLALIGGLFAIAWDRQMRNPDPPPTMLAALALQNDAATPHPIESIDFSPECVAQELEAPAQTSDQRNIPNYTPAMLVTSVFQMEIYQMFITYLACQQDRGGGDVLTDEEQTYLSPRLLQVLGLGENASDGQASADLFDPTQRVISDFPLPLNRTPFSEDASGEYTATTFDYSEIYVLPNERYAAVGGSISTHMLQTGVPIRTADGELMYVSFIAQGDGYVIDEMFLICPSDISASLADDADGTLPESAPFDPAELIRNPDATCG